MITWIINFYENKKRPLAFITTSISRMPSEKRISMNIPIVTAVDGWQETDSRSKM